VIGFTKTVGFLANVHTFEFVVVQQMIAAVFELVDSIEFKIAEWTHAGFIRTDSDQLLEVEQSACYTELSFCLDNCSIPSE
jgi:hypothetical protein